MRVLVVENDPSDPVGRLGQWLTGAGVEIEVRSVADLPESLDGYDGLVVLGMAGSANDAQFAPARRVLREAVEREVPTLGICGGAQLLAVAHGGRVEPNPDGPEVGAYLVAKRVSAATDPLFGPVPITPDVLQWHWDAVTKLPAGAHQLASSPLCENQAFRLGRLAWGVQFHIETTPEVVRAWAREDADQLADHDLDLIVSRTDAVHDDIEQVWRPFAEAFAGIVRDPDAVRAPRGVPTTMAAPITDPAAIRAALAAEVQAAHHARVALPMPVVPPGGQRPDGD